MVMRSRIRATVCLGALVLLGSLSASVGEAHAQGARLEDDLLVDAEVAPFSIIAHPSVQRTSIDWEELQAISLGRTRYWAAGAPIQLVLGPDGAESRQVWVEDIATMNTVQFTQYWIGATFRGRALVAPRAVPSEQMAVRLVAALPGAIAIVPTHLVTADVTVLDWEGGDKEDRLSRLLE